MFYVKLAWANLKKNRPIYVPFLLSMIFLVILNLLMQIMLNNPGMATMPNATSVKSMFGFGRDVILIFSVIFAFYTNSFLIKRRQKELGLYNILGMDKKALGLMLTVESILSLLITLTVGLISGGIISKLLFLVLKKMTGFGADFVFHVSLSMILFVMILFAGLFLLLLGYNIWQLAKTNPIELLHGSETGEREPKAHWLLSLIGFISLGGGYFLSITIESPVAALPVFFVAIVLVIIGTYLLMITASTTILKYLRTRPQLYYKPKAFVNISGMLYRMKQNGAGLASICILSTMVLVTVSSTAGLFFGQAEVLRNRHPFDISFALQTVDESLEGQLTQLAAENTVTVTDSIQLNTPNITILRQQDGVFSQFDSVDENNSFEGVAAVNIWTTEDYYQLTGKNIELAGDELVLFPISGKYQKSTMQFGSASFVVKEQLTELPHFEQRLDVSDGFIIFVKDGQAVQAIHDGLAATGEIAPLTYNTEVLMNISGSEKNREQFATAVMNYQNALNATIAPETLENPNQGFANASSIDLDRADNSATSGGFLFIGIIFGLSFTVATALIIYYKQISEGYQDASRFEIMQKVGMSHKEVRQTILSQILMVFLFPIALAVLHLAFALPIIRKLLILFGLINQQLITLCAVVAVVVFLLCYFIVYWQTSKVYYRIVERQA